MPSTTEALTILIFLLPGFLTQRVVDALTVRRAISDTELIVEALVFALLDYFLYALLSLRVLLPPLSNLVLQNGALNVSSSSVAGVAVLVSAAVLLGVAQSVIVNRGWFYTLSQKIGLTAKTSAVDVWHDTFAIYRAKWVRVHLQSGVRIVGWPMFYSESSDRQELFLAESYVQKPDGSQYQIEGPGILIPTNAAIQMIELLN